MRRPHVGFLLGKPPQRSPVLPEVLDRLRRDGTLVSVHVPGPGPPLPDWIARCDAVAARGLSRACLAAAQAWEDAGARFCNRVATTRACADRLRLAATLAAADVPVPRGAPAAGWDEVRSAAGARAVVVKAVDGGRGRGAGVLVAEAGRLPRHPPFHGPYLVQERLTTDGWDRKLYVIGPRVAALAKRWPARDAGGRAGEGFSPSAALADLARRAASAAGLEICGVDVVATPRGPVVVDVNPFPSCRGVDGAAASIAAHLRAVATARSALR